MEPAKQAANEVYKLPPKLFDARCKACWLRASGRSICSGKSCFPLNLPA